MKVGGNVEDDRKRLALVRSIIDDPVNFVNAPHIDPKTLEGKKAGPTGSVLMVS